MAQWDGNESSLRCNCGFDIPTGGTLGGLILKNHPLGVPSGGTGAAEAGGAQANLGILSGKTSTTSISSTSPKTITVTFDKPFAEVPIVVATPYCGIDSAGAYGIFCYIRSVTTEAVSIRLSTNLTSALTVGAQWIALGVPAKT